MIRRGVHRRVTFGRKLVPFCRNFPSAYDWPPFWYYIGLPRSPPGHLGFSRWTSRSSSGVLSESILLRAHPYLIPAPTAVLWSGMQYVNQVRSFFSIQFHAQSSRRPRVSGTVHFLENEVPTEASFASFHSQFMRGRPSGHRFGQDKHTFPSLPIAASFSCEDSVM
ncbi:hypothetical protein JAAARDRAFT_59901 [Jaapia argillacea MUCL 33604]|uniref:Uncharacterized protein n=1 Tax=Jaapia argillacea MUCL 33604 TaxID=933084 RepID=A0A067PKM3_9AGAM|nr:hypothetical protein JAAARDRAFT_59901 [Jaapia argillacea MUCL 33604]